jgi:hypothetical protein
VPDGLKTFDVSVCVQPVVSFAGLQADQFAIFPGREKDLLGRFLAPGPRKGALRRVSTVR